MACRQLFPDWVTAPPCPAHAAPCPRRSIAVSWSRAAAAAATPAAVTAAASRTHLRTGAKTGTKKEVSDYKCQVFGFNSISKTVRKVRVGFCVVPPQTVPPLVNLDTVKNTLITFKSCSNLRFLLHPLWQFQISPHVHLPWDLLCWPELLSSAHTKNESLQNEEIWARPGSQLLLSQPQSCSSFFCSTVCRDRTTTHSIDFSIADSSEDSSLDIWTDTFSLS